MPADPEGLDAAAESPAAVDLSQIPEALLAPLLDTAADVLRSLPRTDLPPTARRLASFGKKGLATPAARIQLRRLLENDLLYQGVAVERFLAQPDAAGLLEQWTGAGPERDRRAAVTAVGGAALDGSLALLSSVLVCGRPPGWEFGLGLAIGTWVAEQGAAAVLDRVGVLEERLATVEEARRRADEAKAAAVGKAKALEGELREERQARRIREQGGSAEADEARRRAATLEAELAQAERRRADAEARAAREAERVRAAEARLKAAQEEIDAGRRERRIGDHQRSALAGLSADAARLSERLAELARPPAGPAPPPAPEAPKSPKGPKGPKRPASPPPGVTRRVKVNIPLGMRVDSLQAVNAMLQTPRLNVIVDGYNVSMLAWPDLRPADQRDRLSAALSRFHLRVRCSVTVVFDGADVAGVPPGHRPGVTVMFSAPGQEADEVVVEQAGKRPPSTPVLVVTSDAAVREGAEEFGAQVVPAALFLEVLRH